MNPPAGAPEVVSYPPLLVVVGPTAVGKTNFSLAAAGELRGEIISADSRLFYRGMDIGTDKPSVEVRQRIPHHLVDICLPDERVSLGQYLRLARAAFRDIHLRSRVPLLVGGTGQYVQAVVQGWQVPAVPPHERLRQVLHSLGQAELQRWLGTLDPDSAANIDPRNVRRVIRALEVTLTSGVLMSRQQVRETPKLDIKQIGLTTGREALRKKVDIRVDSMMADGLLEEVRYLKQQGYDRHLSSMSGLGYRQLLAYLDGELSLEEAVERIKFETHRFIRQQANWFRQDDDSISWYDASDSGWEERAMAEIMDWIGKRA